MDKQKPIILNQAELDWETWDDPDLAGQKPQCVGRSSYRVNVDPAVGSAPE